MTTVFSSPHAYGVPHGVWRKRQYETVLWLLDNNPELAKFRMVDAPTGSGKSANACAISSHYKTVVLTHTKSLQEAYRNIYHAAICFGKSNYVCVNVDRPSRWATVEDCIYKDSVRECPVVQNCEYYIRKNTAKVAQFTCLNYAIWMVDHEHWPSPDALVLDEAHLLSDLVLDYAGIQITQRMITEWELPQLPIIVSNKGGSLFSDRGGISSSEQALDWIASAARQLNNVKIKLENHVRKSSDPEDITRLRKVTRLVQKFDTVTNAVIQGPQNVWYIKSEFNYLEQPVLVIKPLTARFQFPRMFLQERILTVAMSATIGNPEMLARECGIPEWSNIVVPNQWAPEVRPVYILDAPAMGRKSIEKDPEAPNEQARVIAKAIQQYPDNWSGIIHVTRKSEAPLLAERLAKYGLADRVWVPPQESTTQQIKAWEERKRHYPGSLMISWAFHVGYDGLDERIAIVAKVQFPFIGEPYERARLHYDFQLYRQRAAWAMEQSLGRTRRGRPQDYDIDGVNGFVAIADSQWSQLKKYMSQSILDAIVLF